MNDERALEYLLAERLGARGIPLADAFYDEMHTFASRTRQRPRWLAILKEPPMRYRSHVAFGSPIARMATLAAVTLLVAIVGAGALVASAQPSPSPAPAVVTAAPVEVTGRIECGPPVRTSTSEQTTVPLADGEMTVTRKRGDVWQQTATMSDPRLTGTYSISESLDEYRLGGASSGVTVASGTRRIENDDGAWQGSDSYVYLPDGSTTALSMVLVGEGAYEGLTAIWEELSPETPCSAEIRGVIVAGDVPAVPDPFIPE